MAVTIDGTNGITSSGSITTQSASGVIFSDSSALTAASSPYVLKNRIINGAMVIDQRNAGASQTIANGAYNYTVDRWRASSFGATCTGQQIFSTNQYLYQFTGAASVTNIDVNQRIESKNCLDLASKTVTLSATIANSLLTTVTWQAFYANSTDNFSATTAIASGTWTVNSTLTTYSTQISLPANAINGLEIHLQVAAQTSGTWQFTNVQLEIGTSATPFERRLYNQELANCQRYCQTVGANELYGNNYSSTQALVSARLPVVMRANPTATLPTSGAINGYFATGAKTTATAPTAWNLYPTAVSFVSTGYTGLTANDPCTWNGTVFLLSAEL